MKQVFVGAPCGMWGGVKTNEKSRHRKFMKIETDSALQQNHSIFKYQIHSKKEKERNKKQKEQSEVLCTVLYTYLHPVPKKSTYFSQFLSSVGLKADLNPKS